MSVELVESVSGLCIDSRLHVLVYCTFLSSQAVCVATDIHFLAKSPRQLHPKALDTSSQQLSIIVLLDCPHPQYYFMAVARHALIWRSKGQDHTVTKTVMVAWLLVKYAAAAAGVGLHVV